MATTDTRERAATVSVRQRRGHRTWSNAVVPALLLLVLAVGIWATWQITIDDSYITFRYSQHLAEGYGPVWNIGEDPVEGFTNFAWMVWNAAFAWFGASLPVVSKLTSAILAAAIVLQLWRALPNRAGRIIALGSYLLFLPTYVHITAGLETTAVAAVLLRLIVLTLRVLRGERVRSWELPALVLLAGTLRPECVAAGAPAVLTWLWLRRREPPTWAWTGAAAAVGTLYFVWRWSYYGQLLPNTFYIKFGNLALGQDWLQATAVTLLPLLVLAGSLALRRPGGPVVLIGTTVAVTYLPYAVSGPSMDYLSRFAFHAFPILCLAAGLALDVDITRRMAATVAAITVGWVALAGITADDAPTIVNYGPDLDRSNVAIGRGLAAADVPLQDRTLAVSDAGVMPYFSDWNSTDFIGLNDEAIAAGRTPDDVVAAAAPSVIVIRSTGPQQPADAYGLDVRRATAGYRLVSVVQTRDKYFQLVYSRPALADQIGTEVGRAALAAREAAPDGTDLTLHRWIHRLRTQLTGS